MNLNSENLKTITDFLEQFAHIVDIKIDNSAYCIKLPKKNEVKTVDLNRPNTYTITFVMGNGRKTQI